MAIVENGGSVNVVGSSNPSKIVHKDVGFDHQSMKQNNDQQEFQKKHSINGNGVLDHHDNVEHKGQAGAQNIEHQKVNGVDLRNGGVIDGGQHEGKPGARIIEHQKVNGVELRNGEGVIDGGDEGFKKEMRDLEEMLSKLNPMAEEFVPPSLSSNNHKLVPFPFGGVQFGFDANNFVVQSNLGIANGNFSRRKKNGYGNGRKRMNTRTGMAQREDVIRRTVYVSEIDHQVTEEQLAALFLTCGQVVDCRICGDPNSVLRFAFIEFTDEEGARSALSLAGTVLGFYPVRVLPSKTAIAPVNPTFLPRSEDEREMCARTVYCANIDKKVTQEDVRLFFESFCGEVQRLRLLGDYHHSTRIAFVEFVMAESAIAALSCSGAILGSLPIRVSPSKTPVRPRAPRSPVL